MMNEDLTREAETTENAPLWPEDEHQYSGLLEE